LLWRPDSLGAPFFDQEVRYLFRAITARLETALEEDSGDLLGDLIRFVAALLLGQGRIVLDRGTNADDKGLIAHSAHHYLGMLVFFCVNAACDGFIARGGEGRALGRALREVGGELFGDVGHEVDGDAKFVDGRALLTGEFADSGGLLAELDSNGNSDGAAENSARSGFIKPRTLRLCMADGGREQREA